MSGLREILLRVGVLAGASIIALAPSPACADVIDNPQFYSYSYGYSDITNSTSYENSGSSYTGSPLPTSTSISFGVEGANSATFNFSPYAFGTSLNGSDQFSTYQALEHASSLEFDLQQNEAFTWAVRGAAFLSGYVAPTDSLTAFIQMDAYSYADGGQEDAYDYGPFVVKINPGSGPFILNFPTAYFNSSQYNGPTYGFFAVDYQVAIGISHNLYAGIDPPTSATIDFGSLYVTESVVPEPSGLTLLGLGGTGVAIFTFRRRWRAAAPV